MSGRFVITNNTEVHALDLRFLNFAPAVESSCLRVLLHDTYANVTYLYELQTVN